MLAANSSDRRQNGEIMDSAIPRNFFNSYLQKKGYSVPAFQVRSNFRGSIATLYRLLNGDQPFSKAFLQPLAKFASEDLGVHSELLERYLTGLDRIAPAPVAELQVLQHAVDKFDTQQLRGLIERNEKGAAVSRTFYRTAEPWLFIPSQIKQRNELAVANLKDRAMATEIVEAKTSYERWYGRRFMVERDALPFRMEIYVPLNAVRALVEELRASNREELIEDMEFHLVADVVRQRNVSIGFLMEDSPMLDTGAELQKVDVLSSVDKRFVLRRERESVAHGWVERDQSAAKDQYIDSVWAMLGDLPGNTANKMDPDSVASFITKLLS